jgi:hypothetical protein
MSCNSDFKNVLMTKSEIQVKLKMAQDILSDVYHYACENNLQSIESQMSCADSCIGESLDYLIKV